MKEQKELAFSYAQLAACAKRDLRRRKKVYWYQVADGRLSQQKAEEEIALMETIFEHFDDLANPRLL